MPLDDFFAKKEKKKLRKTNPNLLIEKLTKVVEKSKISNKDTSTDPTKYNSPENDEWENVDDEDDLDLPNIDVSKLSFNRVDETSNPSVTEKDKKEKSSEGDQAKVVWGGKRNVDEEAKDEEPLAPPPPEPVPEAPVLISRYIPVHLRKQASTAAKPNVANTSDFPTLDAAVSEPTPSKDRVHETATPSSAASAAEDASWSQAGTPRRLPQSRAAANTLPLAFVDPVQNTPNPSSYVPPFMRAGRQETLRGDGGRQPSNGSAFSSERNRSRDPPYGGGSRQTYEGFTMQPPSEATAASGGGWSRGQVISTGATNGVDQQPRGTNSVFRPTPRPTFDFSAIATVKTFKEKSQDKTEFEVSQSNRFAGFNAT